MDIDDPHDPFSDLAGDGYPDNGGPLDNEGNSMTPYRQCLEDNNPKFNASWIEPLSFDNCNTRQEIVWVSALNNLLEYENNKLKDYYEQYTIAKREFENNKDEMSRINMEQFKQTIKGCLNHLELISIVRNTGIIPGVQFKEGSNQIISWCRDYLRDQGFIFRPNSNIIETNLSQEFNDKEMLEPAQDQYELDDLKDITLSPEVKADILSDLERDNISNKKVKLSELSETNEEPFPNKRSRSEQSDTASSHESLAITSSPRVIKNPLRPSQRPSTTSSLSQRPSIASSSISNPRQPSKLSIEWKPDSKGKGKSSFSVLSFNLNKPVLIKKVTGDYIAGFTQADGSFSAVLTSKTRKTKRYFNISLVFTIVQHEKYKNLILEIQKYFGGIGNWYFNKSDKTIRYQITKQSDLKIVIIPFFIKHQLRSGKLLSFLHFKYIAEVMSTRAHWNNKKILLSLIVISSHLNPLGKLGNKIRYLTPNEQHYVINNIQPEGIDTSKLTESIQNFKQNKLTLEFIHGLFESNTNNYKKVSIEDQDFIRNNFLSKDLKIWKFKEYYTGLNQTPALKSTPFNDLGKRSFSTLAGDTPGSVVPVIKYENADTDKLAIIKENKGKSGV